MSTDISTPGTASSSRHTKKARKAAQSRKQPRHRRLVLEPLEDRRLLTLSMWIGLQKDGPDEHTAQRFTGPGNPAQVIGNSFGTYGTYYNLAASGTTLFSGSTGSVHRWDGTDGSYIGGLALSKSLYSEIGSALSGIGTTTSGDLLFTPFGYSTEQRGLAKYSPTGTHLQTYTHPNLQHALGTAAGNGDAVFVASRYNPGSGWVEDVLMFTASGSYVGAIDGGTSVGDVAIMDTKLYVLVYDTGIKVYDLNGSSLPSYSSTIAFPAGVTPSRTRLDEIYAHDGVLYVAEDNDNQWHKISLAGTLLETYNAQTRGTYNYLGSMAIVDSGGAPSPVDTMLYAANMNADPGWTFDTGSQWAWGTPTGSGGDPTSGYTGTNVVGYNLNGPYPNSMTSTY